MTDHRFTPERTNGGAYFSDYLGDEVANCDDVRAEKDAALIADARTSLPRALDALEEALGFASRCATACRAVGNSGEERHWLDLIITIETALRAEL